VSRFIFHSRSPRDTRDLGARLGARLAPGDVVALAGELGAGKTELVRGIAAGLGVPPEEVASPSFALVYEYEGRVKLVHVDLYRLPTLTPELFPDLEDYLAGPQVVCVEWADRLGELVPPDYVEIRLVITGDRERRIECRAHGPRSRDLLEALNRQSQHPDT
jgi:tRNA threonylcarbamoyladenosine biosynthesis protein TsaE